MPQIADKCPGIIQFCRTRVTLLDDDGSPASGAGNYYVSDKMVTVAITPDVEAGQRRTVRSGCDCVVATQRSTDTLLGYTFELIDGVWEPALEALMLGYTALEDTSDDPVVIGYNVSGDQLVCGGTQPQVAFEAWAYAWDGNGQDADLGAIHFIWPLTKWQQSARTLGAEFLTPALTGFSERNENWVSPYDDSPTDGTTTVEPDFYAQFMVELDSLPDASCGLQTVVIA